MGWIERQQEVKLDILESLVRSQRAITRMVETAADVSVKSEFTQKELHASIEALVRYQQAIMEKVCGIQIFEVKKSAPGDPWTNRTAGVRGFHMERET